MAVTPSKKDRVFTRDGFCCRLCKATENLTVDHIIPKSLGGTDEMGNLRTLCQPCNGKRGNTANGIKGTATARYQAALAFRQTKNKRSRFYRAMRRSGLVKKKR